MEPFIQKEKDSLGKTIVSKDGKYELELGIKNTKIFIKAAAKSELEKSLYLY